MIKKISAIILALMLCLSVVVMPASASGITVEGNDGVAFYLEWDKTSYNPGDSATLKVYMDVVDTYAIESGAITIGLKSTVISRADNDIADIKANATVCDLFASYFKDPTNQIAWLNTSVGGRVNTANTASEQELYDDYIKLGMSKNTSGTHENAGLDNDGLYGSEIDSTTPVYTLTFKISESVTAGTSVNAAITTGTLSVPSKTAPSTYIKTYTDPGSGTGKANIAATSTNITNADTTVANGGTSVTIGSAAELAVTYWKDQIKFLTDGTGAYAKKFDYRMLATIDNFDDVFESAADAMDVTDNHGILEAGFIFSKTGTVDKDKAIAQIKGGAAEYSAVTGAYVSTSFETGKYVMACYVGNIADSDVDTALSALGYVKYMQDGVEKVVTFDAVKTSTFRTLYDKHVELGNRPAL